MIKLSNTSKMKVKNKKVRSWSLEAGISCPMSKNAEVCKGCYAKKGMYRFPVVKAVREHNRTDYKTTDWVERMIAECSKLDMVRLFDSGDCESTELAEKIYQVIKQTPKVTWWFPTRMDKDPEVNKILRSINLLPNVSLRLSADNIGFKQERPGVNSYVIRATDMVEAKKRGIFICPVTLPGSTQKSCDTCTYCYGKGDVAYILH